MQIFDLKVFSSFLFTKTEIIKFVLECLYSDVWSLPKNGFSLLIKLIYEKFTEVNG